MDNIKYWNQMDFTIFAESRSKVKKNHRKYSSFVGAFDIETSTVEYEKGKKVSFMYVWQMAVENQAFYGRTFNEFLHCLQKIKIEMGLSSEFKLVVYVHNLKYDFSFYKREASLEGDFVARSRRTILKHTAQDCFEFRDSYCYTEESLDEMGEEIGIPKIKGYDYKKVRTSYTPLTEDELQYAIRDVLILTRYYRHEATVKHKLISELPLTITQSIKRIIRGYFEQQSQIYKGMMQKRQLRNNDRDKEILKLLKKSFFGAFVYSNPNVKGQNIYNVHGVDIDASYGAQCLLHRFPMDKFEPLPIPASTEDLKTNPIYKGKAMLITFAVKELKAKYNTIGLLPLNIANYHFRGKIKPKNVKGKRTLHDEKTVLTLTDVDFSLFLKLYDYDGIKFISIEGSKYGQLPKYMLDSVVELYTQKVKLQLEQAEIKKKRPLTLAETLKYIRTKVRVSRVYGILVQDPERPEYALDTQNNVQRVWKCECGCLNTGEECIGCGKTKPKKNDYFGMAATQFQPVLYQWGVWVVAWARYEIIRALFMIAENGGKLDIGRILYSDTDSLYFRDCDYTPITKYNVSIDARIKKLCEVYHYDYEILKNIGKFKSDEYEVFKTLGLKQYAFVKNDIFDYRCAGLPRIDYEYTEDGKIKKDSNGNPINYGMSFFDNFDTNEEKLAAFNTELYIPSEHTKILKSVYHDDGLPDPILVTDYLGGQIRVNPKSWVTLEPTGYDFSKSPFDIFKSVDAEDVAILLEKTNPT